MSQVACGPGLLTTVEENSHVLLLIPIFLTCRDAQANPQNTLRPTAVAMAVDLNTIFQPD